MRSKSSGEHPHQEVDPKKKALVIGTSLRAKSNSRAKEIYVRDEETRGGIFGLASPKMPTSGISPVKAG